jgi:hypothetical protein
MQILKATIKIALPVVCKSCKRVSMTTPITLDIENHNLISLVDVITNHPDARIGTHFPIG